MENVQRIDFGASEAPEHFVESLHNTGFAVLYNHSISEARINQLYQSWEKFFLYDEKIKKTYEIDPLTQFGWVPPSLAETAKGRTIRDLKEFYNFYASGTCPVELKKHTQELFNELLAIGKTLLEWIQNYSPTAVNQLFSQPLPEMVSNSPSHLFRINYYPALIGDEEIGAVRAAAHTDIDLLTVLTAGTTDGLQTRGKNGEWHDVPCEHGNLVINIGDMLQEASKGYFPSTVHRVLNPTGDAVKKSRMSCPMFIHPRSEVVLSDRYTAGAYLHERLVELGLRKDIPIGNMAF